MDTLKDKLVEILGELVELEPGKRAEKLYIDEAIRAVESALMEVDA